MNQNLTAIAKDNMVRISPTKLTYIANSIVNMKVSSAINQLKFFPKRISGTVLKVLNAAIANAENNKQLDIDNLYVKEAFVGKGIVMKRFHARARGRGARILKPFSHLTIILSEETEEKNGSKD